MQFSKVLFQPGRSSHLSSPLCGIPPLTSSTTAQPLVSLSCRAHSLTLCTTAARVMLKKYISFYPQYKNIRLSWSSCCLLCQIHLSPLFLTSSSTSSKDIPWLVWLTGLSASLQIKGSPVRFPVWAHAGAMGQVLTWGRVRGNHTLMFLSLSFSLLSLRSKNKY